MQPGEASSNPAGGCLYSACWARSTAWTTASVAIGSCPPSCMSRSALSFPPTIATTCAPSRGVSELAFERAPAELHLRGEARGARLVQERECAGPRRVVPVGERHEELDRPAAADGIGSPARRIRSIPAAQPIPGVGGPPELLDQPVVAAAAAHAALRAERVGGELEDGPRVVVETPHERRVDLVGDAARRRAARGPAAKCSASSASRWSSSRGASAITPACRGRSESNARSGFRSIRSRTSLGERSLVRAQVPLQLFAVARAALGAAEARQAQAHRRARPSRASSRRDSTIDSASTAGSSDPSASAPTCQNCL